MDAIHGGNYTILRKINRETLEGNLALMGWYPVLIPMGKEPTTQVSDALVTHTSRSATLRKGDRIISRAGGRWILIDAIVFGAPLDAEWWRISEHTIDRAVTVQFKYDYQAARSWLKAMLEVQDE